MMQCFRSHRTIVLLIIFLSSLAVAQDGGFIQEQYGLIMERMPSLYQEWALTKRDVCADAIPGTTTSTCTPGNTLCCTPNNTNTAFPQCQKILGSGYCCVSEDNCYIDTPSDCAASNSVPCTMLAAGTTKACCPPFTVCPGNFNQSSTVRCNILQNIVASSSSSSSSSSATKSRTTSSSSKTTSSESVATPTTSTSTSGSASGTSTPGAASATTSGSSPNQTNSPSGSSSLSPGADAGIGIGVAILVLAIAALAFWAYRRGKKRGAAARAQAALGTQMEGGPSAEHGGYYDPTKYSDVPQYQQGFAQKHELPSTTTSPYQRPAELGGQAGYQQSHQPQQHELP